LKYFFDCGLGAGLTASASNLASCPTTDNGSRTVKGRIEDKDGGATEYTASVTINNVAPTGHAQCAGVGKRRIVDRRLVDRCLRRFAG
jgi:hypothetical protein